VVLRLFTAWPGSTPMETRGSDKDIFLAKQGAYCGMMTDVQLLWVVIPFPFRVSGRTCTG
jgi:hypothetical protein